MQGKTEVLQWIIYDNHHHPLHWTQIPNLPDNLRQSNFALKERRA
jgi:hypothetical protein